MKIRIILLVLLTTMTISVQAKIYNEEMGFIIGSKHFDTKKDYNEINPGIYIRYKGYIAGAYKNSYSEPAIFAGKTIGYDLRDKVRVYLGYGLIYGYGWDNGLSESSKGGVRLLAFILPTISINNGNGLYLNMHIVGNAVALSFSKTF